MSKTDALLVSLVAGMSLFTLYLFASDYPGPSVEAAAEERSIEGIVLHGLQIRHGQAALDYPFHVSLGPHGPQFTRYWETGEATNHTGRPEVNDLSISIAIEADASPDTLIRILIALCREYNLPAGRIRSHEEMEPERVCPGPRIDMDELRAVIEDRLR